MHDVLSPIDLRSMDDAIEWESTAMSKRPWRTEFFVKFVESIKTIAPVKRVLELGSGPGFLAEHLLTAFPDISYEALDYSAAMHELAKNRLGPLTDRVRFIERNFKNSDWTDGLDTYDAIVTNQAIHELRQKRHAPTLHYQAKALLVKGGVYLVCDHFAGDGGMANDELYMSVCEQREALISAGFTRVKQLLLKGGLVLHVAT